MKLKHLTLRGFKSFADRTRLDFASGVNVVVGPNGSGKSNILDAIAWVMGTQATKTLRTDKMEDVVFAGTATRPKLSHAEVQLTFANDDKLMPLNLSEITITRRLFRDGTSEYELNGAPCRLLDIQDLLSDGGIGRQQHVLVGQGQVGDILNARPEDHRSIIEEAAGVMKHRSRRERAVRRLERTDHDVERLEDILKQQRKALRPLKRQANAAGRYDSVKSEARALRLFLTGEDLRRIHSRQAVASKEHTKAVSLRDEADGGLEDLMSRLDLLRAEAGEVGASLTADTAAAARLETVKERLNRVGTVARERRRSIESAIEGADDRRDDLDTEREDLESSISESVAARIVAQADSERCETALKALEDEERSLAEQIQLPTEGVVANLRGDLRSLESADMRDAAELDQSSSRSAVVFERIDQEITESERLIDMIRNTDGRTESLQDNYSNTSGDRAMAQERWESDSTSFADQRLVVASCSARVEALESALDGLVDEGARDIAISAPGVVGLLVQQLDVPSDMAAAVDAALGSWRDAYLVEDGASVTAAVSAVKGAGTGGVSFALPRETGESSVRAAAVTFGVVALSDCLGAGAVQGVADAHLGNVVLVEGWQMARSVVEAYPDVVAVTPEGDVITVEGILVAQPDGAGPAALEASRVQLEIAERELQRATSLMAGSQRTFDRTRGDERISLEALEAVEAELAGYTEALALLQRSQAASEAERDRLDLRIDAIEESSAARTERITGLRTRLTEFEGEEAVRQAAWDALNQRRTDVAALRDEARRMREHAAADLASIVERTRMSERRLEVVIGEIQQLTLLPKSAASVDQLAAVEEHAGIAIGSVDGHIESLRIRQLELREHAGSTNAQLSEAEDLRESLELQRRQSVDTAAALDVELTELRVRAESTAEGLRRDLDVDEDVALAAPMPEATEETDRKARLESLEADLRRMGPINPLAAQEYEELAAEAEELERQLADLNQSRSDVRKVIAALDEKMVTLFEEAFDEIAALYHENFSLVFPGGVGGLRLDDPDSPLTSGVVVEAQPAGKKVGKLSLLSGGERSLAALAFLFAVFRARPSPFYVLDEVEAALDDANLHRFLRLVDTLRKDVQLVIITHQQQTMEAADVLYGVTMEPGESSKVLSKRMTSITV